MIAKRCPRHSLAVLAAALTVISPAGAHHSPIIFDTDTVIVIEGEISRFDWRSPHTVTTGSYCPKDSRPCSSA